MSAAIATPKPAPAHNKQGKHNNTPQPGDHQFLQHLADSTAGDLLPDIKKRVETAIRLAYLCGCNEGIELGRDQANGKSQPIAHLAPLSI